MRVVIAEDNAENRYLLEMLLRGGGYEVAAACDGREALELQRRDGADFIVSDILMPRMDGFQLCREVKSDPALRAIPFVFYTATYTTERDRQFALSLGASRFIVKPVEPADFLREIREVLEKAGLGKLPVPEPTLGAERDYLREYSARVTAKLEKKIGELSASEERLRTILASTREAIISVDLEGLVTSWNEAARRLFGYEEGEILGKSISRFTTEEFGEEQRELIAEARRRGAAGPRETVRIAKDGRRVPVEITLGLMRGATEAEVGITAVIRDLTEARERERFIEDLFRFVGEGLAVIDRGLRIRAANPAYAALAGLAPEEVTGRTCHEVTHGRPTPCEGEGLLCPVRESLRTGLPAAAHHSHVGCGGGTHDAEVRSYPLHDERGEVSSVIQVVRDVSVERRLEEQLRQAQKTESVGILAGGVAHDFNNLLGVVMRHASLIGMAATGEQQRSSATEIVQACERGARLTRSLLAFCRKQVMELKPVRVDEAVEGATRLMRVVLGEDVELRLSLRAGAAVVLADTALLGQVLLNLATNARDAMPGGGTLIVETERMAMDADFVRASGFGTEGAYARITVTDSGAGMDAATQTRAFEPFFTTKEVGRGTGLGLAMVYGTIRQHGGHVHLYSEPGMGTTVKIYLPLVADAAAPAREIPHPSPRGGGETILIVEDDAALRRVMSALRALEKSSDGGPLLRAIELAFNSVTGS